MPETLEFYATEKALFLSIFVTLDTMYGIIRTHPLFDGKSKDAAQKAHCARRCTTAASYNSSSTFHCFYIGFGFALGHIV
ncbi:MAG: hypothetical protein H3C28_02900 [Sphingomonadales bacterium]|nr:hypothetical protein [Sphingomonadales bacterium]